MGVKKILYRFKNMEYIFLLQEEATIHFILIRMNFLYKNIRSKFEKSHKPEFSYEIFMSHP